MKKVIFIIFIGLVGLLLGISLRYAWQKVFTGGEREEKNSQVIETEEPVSPAPKEDKSLTLVFVGDVMLDRGVRAKMEENLDPLYPFLLISEKLKSADILFGNLEGPISDKGAHQGSVYSFRFEPVGALNALEFAGFDVLSIANNHILDYGREALVDTVERLGGRNIKTIGAGKNFEQANAPAIFEKDGVKIAYLAFTNLYPKSLEAEEQSAGVSRFNLEEVAEKLATLDLEFDILAVSMHWGEEYETRANENQKAVARAFIDAGADLVIGHHPHVVQEVEEYVPATNANRIGYIAYSLGNFVFDQNFSEETRKGLMLEVEVRSGKIEAVREIPIRFTPTFQPYVADAERG